MSQHSFIERILEKAQKEKDYEFPNMLFYGERLQPILEIIKEFCYHLSPPTATPIDPHQPQNKYLNLTHDFKLNDHQNILYMDCVYESSIIDIRNRVQHFIKSQFHLKQGRKIIVFNNLDELNDEAQCALRLLMEQNNTNIFLGVAKDVNNVVAPICSRMLLVYVNGENMENKLNKKDKIDNINPKLSYYKYNTITHSLFIPTEKALKHSMATLSTIVDEFNKEEDVLSLVACLNELCVSMYERHRIDAMKSLVIDQDYMNLMDKKTLIMVWLVDYLERITNFVKSSK